MGYNNVYKGLPMLADTLELLTPEVLSRFHFYIYAQSLQSIEWRFRRLEPRLGGLTIGHGYQYYDIPWICGGKDLGLVTSVWWDNAPQTVFEFFACRLPVLAAEIGGIPDFVRDGHNGLLFRANDRYDLARRLAALARNPEVLSDLRRNVRPPKGMAVHAAELEELYAECLSAKEPRVRSPIHGIACDAVTP
jgi:glycosyltransferase involved in cell wall biosynthesis